MRPVGRVLGVCVIDVALWLSPLEGANPSGEDLRNDPRFHELERLTEPQIKITHDDRNKPVSESSIPVDWPASSSSCRTGNGSPQKR